MKNITKDISKFNTTRFEKLTEVKFLDMLEYYWKEGERVTELTVNQEQMDDLKAWLQAPWHLEFEKLTYNSPYGEVEIRLSQNQEGQG